MNDEINIRFGGNLNPLARAMRSAKQMAKDFGNEIKASFSKLGASIVGAFTLGAVISQVRKTIDWVEQLQRIAEGTGLSSGLVQDVLNLAKASGIAETAVEGMLDKFVANLKPGSDPEKALLELADRMSQIKDPSELARLAVDNFGKSGIKLIPILREGRTELKRMADEFTKMSEAQQRDIQRADKVLDEFGVRMRVWTAEAIGGVMLVGRAFKDFFTNAELNPFTSIKGTLDADFNRFNAEEDAAARRKNMQDATREAEARAKAADKVAAAQRRFAETENRLSFNRASGLEKEALLAVQIVDARRELEAMGAEPEEKRFEQMEKIAEIEERYNQQRKKNNADEIKQLQLIQQLQESNQTANQVLGDAKSDRSKFTIGELVASGLDRQRHGGRLRNAEIRAMQVANVEHQARLARFFGRGEVADQLTDRALDMRKQMGDILVSDEAAPFAAMEKAIVHSAAKLTAIERALSEDGIVLKDE